MAAHHSVSYERNVSMMLLIKSTSGTHVVLLNFEPSAQVDAVGLIGRPVNILLSRLGPVAELGKSSSGDFDLLNGKSDGAENLTMLIGIGLQSTAESCNLLGQIVGDGRSDSGDDVVCEAQEVSNETGSRGSKDCGAGGSEKESRRSHCSESMW